MAALFKTDESAGRLCSRHSRELCGGKASPPYLVEAEVATAIAQGCFVEAKVASKRPRSDASHHADIVTEVHTDVSVVETGGSPHVVTDVSVVEAGGSPSIFAVPIAPTPRRGTLAAALTLAAAPTPFTAARETAVSKSYLAVNGGYLDVGISGVALRDAEIVFSALLRENLCRSESSTALKHVAAAIAAARGMTHRWPPQRTAWRNGKSPGGWQNCASSMKSGQASFGMS
mmetsp:Transcript_12658/g.29759  ORF Transcript_12658/g.29759 Transcript_12658/m.29759 type:complete len:231 (+) Transcript_12658:1-693(+)